MVGGRPAVLGAGLGFHARFGLVPVEPPLDGAVEAELGRRLDGDHGVVPSAAAGLGQERHFEDDNRAVAGRLEDLEVALPDQGVDRLFQALAAGRVGEHRAPQCLLVDRAVRVQHLGAEQFGNRLCARLARPVEVGDQGVGIRDDATRFGEHAAHRRLAAGDSAGESDP